MNNMLKLIIIAGLLIPLPTLAAGGGAAPVAPAVSSAEHFHPKGKMPSEHTGPTHEKWTRLTS